MGICDSPYENNKPGKGEIPVERPDNTDKINPQITEKYNINPQNITNNNINPQITANNKLDNNTKLIDTTQNAHYIVAEFYINMNDVNKNISIINSYENEKKKRGEFNFEENLKNENDIKECEILIEGKPIPFSYCYTFNSIGTFRIVYTFHNHLKSLKDMFSGCECLKSIDFTNFKTQSVINMSNLFSDCSSLTNINFTNFDTQNVTEMNYMFNHCSSLTFLDLSIFNTQNVRYMSYMFAECSSLLNINLSSFDTKNVMKMDSMFYECTSLTNLNLSNFITKNVTDMFGMFDGCTNLTNLNLSNFTTENCTEMRDVFNGCDKLSISNLICSDGRLLSEIKTLQNYNL